MAFCHSMGSQPEGSKGQGGGNEGEMEFKGEEGVVVGC